MVCVCVFISVKRLLLTLGALITFHFIRRKTVCVQTQWFSILFQPGQPALHTSGDWCIASPFLCLIVTSLLTSLSYHGGVRDNRAVRGGGSLVLDTCVALNLRIIVQVFACESLHC